MRGIFIIHLGRKPPYNSAYTNGGLPYSKYRGQSIQRSCSKVIQGDGEIVALLTSPIQTLF